MSLPNKGEATSPLWSGSLGDLLQKDLGEALDEIPVL